MSLDSLCRWQVQISVDCAWRIPAHLRCTQCSILLHLMDICFLTCIFLWQILQIQTFLFRVVGPGLVSTSPAFVSNSASHPAGPHGRHAQKTVNRAPIAGGGDVRHNLHSSLRSREPLHNHSHRPQIKKIMKMFILCYFCLYKHISLKCSKILTTKK